MTKKVLKLFTGLLFLAAFALTISVDSYGRLTFIKQAKAAASGYQVYSATCPDGITHIVLCGVGDGDCTPSGVCPPPP